jgi:hypothetical protein
LDDLLGLPRREVTTPSPPDDEIQQQPIRQTKAIGNNQRQNVVYGHDRAVTQARYQGERFCLALPQLVVS